VLHNTPKNCTGTKAEIDTYFEELLEPDNDEDFDILAWWKSKLDKFPVLSSMVRDFLAISLSTVSSEYAFSLGEEFLENVEAH
jgi:hypothetical protein